MKKLYDHHNDLTPKVATIGFFDGVHLGHDYLLQQLKNEAVNNNLHSMVVTFSNHPRLFFQPDSGLQQLTLSDEKMNIIEKKGVEYILMLDFTEELSKLTSLQFLQMLADVYGVRMLLVGYDHHFGSDKDASFEQYVEYGAQCGVVVKKCVKHIEHNLIVSSSKIRKALNLWDIELANKLLGYSYSVTGIVEHGSQIGRKIGFPTANLHVDPLKILPAQGVYYVRVHISPDLNFPGVLNIGLRPTVGGKNSTVEVHIVGFDGDIYGKSVTLEFVNFIRHEQKFANLDTLKLQIRKDIDSIISPPSR